MTDTRDPVARARLVAISKASVQLAEALRLVEECQALLTHDVVHGVVPAVERLHAAHGDLVKASLLVDAVARRIP